MAASYAGCKRMSINRLLWRGNNYYCTAFDGGLCNILDELCWDAIYCFQSGICNFLSNQMLHV